jgi:hypothetical protein
MLSWKPLTRVKLRFLQALHLVVDARSSSFSGCTCPVAVVNDSDGRAEAQFQRALADGERVLRMAHSAADHGIDVHVKLGVFGQQLQFPVEHLQALLGNLVGIHVVDRNLQPLQARRGSGAGCGRRSAGSRW